MMMLSIMHKKMTMHISCSIKMILQAMLSKVYENTTLFNIINTKRKLKNYYSESTETTHTKITENNCVYVDKCRKHHHRNII